MSPEQPALCRDFELSDLKPVLQQVGINQVILVQAAQTVEETEFLLDCAEGDPAVGGVVGWTDLESKNVSAALSRLNARRKLIAIRPMIQDIEDPDWVLSAAVDRGLTAVEESGLAFEFLVRPDHLDRVQTVMDRHPNLRAVIDHAAKPAAGDNGFDHWASHMASLARDTRIFCKLSGLTTEASVPWSSGVLDPYLDHLLDHFGPHRLMFGSDWPVLTQCASYADWYRYVQDWLASRSKTSMDWVFGENASRFYKLTGR